MQPPALGDGVGVNAGLEEGDVGLGSDLGAIFKGQDGFLEADIVREMGG